MKPAGKYFRVVTVALAANTGAAHVYALTTETDTRATRYPVCVARDQTKPDAPCIQWVDAPGPAPSGGNPVPPTTVYKPVYKSSTKEINPDGDPLGQVEVKVTQGSKVISDTTSCGNLTPDKCDFNEGSVGDPVAGPVNVDEIFRTRGVDEASLPASIAPYVESIKISVAPADQLAALESLFKFTGVPLPDVSTTTAATSPGAAATTATVTSTSAAATSTAVPGSTALSTSGAAASTAVAAAGLDPSTTPATTNSKTKGSGSSTGVVVAGVSGGIALLLAFFGLIFFVRRRKHDEEQGRP